MFHLQRYENADNAKNPLGDTPCLMDGAFLARSRDQGCSNDAKTSSMYTWPVPPLFNPSVGNAWLRGSMRYDGASNERRRR